ncbi:HIT domain-containing protein [Fictibacillus sp. 7GRE50]|uniref:HIT family protein n=1 Tax=Fictibacillus sp. 7GRE50 TaxID=2745878 RepID=UPI0018CDCA0C|nr:HIT domain-containing protein [Fictibacillus sp. 7GRE50]MBH0166780.1 HIT domain-containing protein [Fictibacillus sp. 7GRE50]
MYTHMPPNYICPFCLVVQGVEDPNNKLVQSKQQDIIYQDEYVTALIATLWWPNNKGHVIIIPNRHYENIFDLPLDIAAYIHKVAQQVSYALKDCYACDGISTRQHNEPGGSQDVWHYHLHVYPRYFNDHLYLTHGSLSDPEERAGYAAKLRAWFQTQNTYNKQRI